MTRLVKITRGTGKGTIGAVIEVDDTPDDKAVLVDIGSEEVWISEGDYREVDRDDRVQMYESEIMANFDWQGIKAEAYANPVEGMDDELYGQCFLGTVFSIMPSGKYWTFWAASNVTEAEAEADEDFMEALEEVATMQEMWIESGEGDPCDLFACVHIERPDPDRPWTWNPAWIGYQFTTVDPKLQFHCQVVGYDETEVRVQMRGNFPKFQIYANSVEIFTTEEFLNYMREYHHMEIPKNDNAND